MNMLIKTTVEHAKELYEDGYPIRLYRKDTVFYSKDYNSSEYTYAIDLNRLESFNRSRTLNNWLCAMFNGTDGGWLIKDSDGWLCFPLDTNNHGAFEHHGYLE